MKGKGKVYLLSIDFRSSKGGISRLANLIFDSLKVDKVYSLNGKSETNSPAIFFQNHKILFLLRSLLLIYFSKPRLLIFDHLNIGRLLVFIPSNWVKKVVIYLHDEEAWRKEKGFYKIALTRATHILCNSEFTKRKFLLLNPEFSAKTKACLPGGIPSTLTSGGITGFHPWFLDERPYCLFVARLWKAHRFKGHWELLNAFRLHIKNSKNPILRLAIVGNGDDADNIESFITVHGLTKSVSLFKNVDDNSLHRFYINSLCLFFPSKREGFGMVYLEAMSLRKACIGIQGQPAEEIIVHQETGLLLEGNSPPELETIIKDIEQNPNKYEKFGRAGYQRYLKHFTKDHFKKRFLLSIEE